MPIHQITPQSEVDNYLEEQIKRVERLCIRNLSYVGEQCVNEGRSANSYYDQTGNLRSSIGYIIIKDGQVAKMSSFELAGRGTDRVTGQRDGREFANKLVSSFPEGIVLIVVAGMSYASYVSAKGINVLDSAELMAEKLVPQMMKKLGFTKR
ncbi:MAG: hypothetical protein ACRCZB_07170 [Bacteroidales bacterium]